MGHLIPLGSKAGPMPGPQVKNEEPIKWCTCILHSYTKFYDFWIFQLVSYTYMYMFDMKERRERVSTNNSHRITKVHWSNVELIWVTLCTFFQAAKPRAVGCTFSYSQLPQKVKHAQCFTFCALFSESRLPQKVKHCLCMAQKAGTPAHAVGTFQWSI